MARQTMGKSNAKLPASTVFMNVVLANFCKASAAFCIFALSTMLPMSSSASLLISGVCTMSRAMCRSSSSALFLTSLRASPTASRRAFVTCGITSPSCQGVAPGSCIAVRVAFKMPMVPTLTFHLPPAAAPRCASNTGSTSSGMALPVGPGLLSLVAKSTALPPGSDFSFASSNSTNTAGKDGNTAGGFHSSARTVFKLLSRRPARFRL
mmetsp:Transcript_67005/g.160566  ORF Transcript_67005/g.160566 Transcript_67005/m.160566 type:complete len:209 (-) Transcript_67005:741-1367(-)